MMIDLRPLMAEKDVASRQDQTRRERLRASAQRLHQEFSDDFELLEAYDRPGGQSYKNTQPD